MTAVAAQVGEDVHGPRWPTIRLRFAVVALVGVVGMAIAMGMASGWWWWQASASALGTDPTGGIYFNLTMVALGLAFVGVASIMGTLLREAAAGLAEPRWALASRVGLWILPFAFAAVGLWRIDEGTRANTIHNVAGFAIPLVIMAMMLTAGWGLPSAFPRFSTRALVILAAIVGLFVVSILEIVSYALMEMLAFVICWWWLLGLARRLDRRLAGTPVPEGPA
jgi:hypothetical protein